MKPGKRASLFLMMCLRPGPGRRIVGTCLFNIQPSLGNDRFIPERRTKTSYTEAVRRIHPAPLFSKHLFQTALRIHQHQQTLIQRVILELINTSNDMVPLVLANME